MDKPSICEVKLMFTLLVDLADNNIIKWRQCLCVFLRGGGLLSGKLASSPVEGDIGSCFALL